MTLQDPLSSQSEVLNERRRWSQDWYTWLSSLVTEIKGTINTIQSDITTLQSDITTIQGDITTIQGDITTIQGDITTIQGDITTLQSDVAGPFDRTGFTNASSAAAGKIGEYLSAVVQAASGVALTANTNANVTSLSITAGDWDVWADCYFGSSFNDDTADCSAGLSATSATLPTTLPYGRGYATGVFTSIDTSITGMQIRVNVSSSTTYFLVALCSDALSGAGNGAYGQIQARRRR